jgi:hypothetical protein
MDNNSKNLLAAAYLSGVGEAFKKSKTLPQNDLETYIEDAKILRREFINRSRNDGYENPIQIIESAKQNAINQLPAIINAKPTVTIPNTKSVNLVTTPSIVRNTANIRVIEPVTPVSNITYSTNVTPLTSVSTVTPTNVTPLTPTNVTPTNVRAINVIGANITPRTNVAPFIVETPKVNNAITSLVSQPTVQTVELAPSPAPAQASSFLGFHFGGKRNRHKTKKSNRRKKAKKHTRK